MANKRLSLDKIQLMKDMVQRGVAPEDIAKHFNIAISSVHNYKNRFKQEGVKFPSVRGKRPTGSVDKSTSDKKELTSLVMSKNDGYNFTVNGVHIHVSGKAKSVVIGAKGIEVNF